MVCITMRLFESREVKKIDLLKIWCQHGMGTTAISHSKHTRQHSNTPTQISTSQDGFWLLATETLTQSCQISQTRALGVNLYRRNRGEVCVEAKNTAAIYHSSIAACARLASATVSVSITKQPNFAMSSDHWDKAHCAHGQPKAPTRV